jgi:hypothetical protein
MRGSIVIEIVKPLVFLVYFIIIIPIPIKLTMKILGVYIFWIFYSTIIYFYYIGIVKKYLNPKL